MSVLTVAIPFDASQTFGKKGRIYVRGAIDAMEYRSSIFPFGGVYTLKIPKDIKSALRKQAGDTVRVEMEADP